MKEEIKNNGKELILQKSFELLLQKGYDAVSISDIQKATGMSRGLIYHYYKGKEELFIEIIDRYFLTLFRFDGNRAAEFGIYEMICYVERKYNEICEQSMLSTGCETSITNYDFLFYQTMHRSPDFARKYRKVRDDELKIWETVVANSMAGGNLPSTLSVPDTARMFIYLIDGAWFNEGTHRNPREMVKEMTRMLLHYYGQIKQ